MPHPRLPELPPASPRRFSAPVRWLGRLVLRASGWRFEGRFPDVPRVVIAVAPHSSNWDAVLGWFVIMALGLDAKWIGKDAIFRFPLGVLARWLGGIPVDRSGSVQGQVEAIAATLNAREKVWIALAPEGTRKAVPRWRTGFYRIAEAAGVPLMLVYFDFPTRTIGLGPLFWPRDGLAIDLPKIRAFYIPWRGKGGKSAVPDLLPTDTTAGDS